MSQRDPLKTYRAKRDFKKTLEPVGRERRPSQKPIFVIQKHRARNLHYDFRLEVGGVLKSWAIPKGPSLNPADKRLAIAVEDHPREYARFEGVIPEGEYGAGTVIVWDQGTFRNLREPLSLERSLEEGQVEIYLQGKKLKGGFVLRRFRRGTKELWLLIKMRDKKLDTRRDILKTAPQSVLSGKTIEELKNK